MKKLTGIFIFTFTLSIFAFGQVTITLNNFPREATFIDSVYSAINPQSQALPSEGANQQWDYSNIGATNLLQIEYTDASSNVNFPDAFSRRNITLTFQGLLIEGFEYDAIEANRWGSLGKHTSEVGYSISNVSGGVNDSIVFIENIDVYSGSTSSLEFPATYQSDWTGTRYETTPFELTVAAFSLQNAPAERVRAVTDARDIVGYGKLKIPDDTGNPSVELDVLLIKSVVTTVDSFFLMGSPAPTQLLDGFQLTQGNTFTSAAYLFYMPDYGNPLLRVGIDATGTIPTGVSYRPDAARIVTTSVSEMSFANTLAVYPNPVNAGQSIMINFNTMVENAKISLTDITGRTIQRNSINTPKEFIKFDIPALGSGVYILNVSAQNGALIKNSRVFIK